MAIRVGIISRHEDVHGVSGTGEPAEVVEFSDGSIAVRWLGKDASTNVTNNIKNVVNVHGHGGKTEVEWLWEQPAPPDPMEAVFEKKILEAGGTTGATAVAETAEAAKEAEAEAIADEIVEENEELSEKVATKVAEKLAEKTAEKVAEKAAETVEKAEDAPE